MNAIIENPLFGVMLSLLAFEIGQYIYSKTKSPIFNPLLTAILLLIGFLYISNISFETYNIGGSFINMFLGPATVVLAVPLYKQLQLFKKHFVPIMAGILIGSIIGIISIIFLSTLLNLTPELITSLVPKSVTTPIGVEITKALGGVPSLTIAAIILSGIIGAVAGPTLCKIFKIEDEIALGIALGTASHALGTSKAMELGEIQGAMSSLSMGIAGIITVFLAPILLYFTNLFI